MKLCDFRSNKDAKKQRRRQNFLSGWANPTQTREILKFNTTDGETAGLEEARVSPELEDERFGQAKQSLYF